MPDSTFLNFFIILFIGAQFTIFGYLSYYLGKNKRFDQRAFGFKTHSTFSNPEVWAVISKDWGLAFMLEGVVSLIVSIVFREYVMRNAVVFSLALVGVVLVTVVMFAIRASKMARQLAEGTEMVSSDAY
jgi:hypothetical protein